MRLEECARRDGAGVAGLRQSRRRRAVHGRQHERDGVLRSAAPGSGAAAREMLRQAAAERWNVAPDECVAINGRIVHRASGKR